ncbi:hypothetical protein BC936DRAFT_144525, partial [Jimgerdemannia flammicorona]
MQRTNSNSQHSILANIGPSPSQQHRWRETTPVQSRQVSPPCTPPSKVMDWRAVLSTENSLGAMSMSSTSSDEGDDGVPTDADWTSDQDGVLLEAYDDFTNPRTFIENAAANSQESATTPPTRMASPPPPPHKPHSIVPPQQTRQQISRAAILKYRRKQRSDSKVKEWAHSLKATRSRVRYLIKKRHAADAGSSFGSRGTSSLSRRPSLTRSEGSSPEPEREEHEQREAGGGPIRRQN